MDDIQKRDRELFAREALNLLSILRYLIVLVISAVFFGSYVFLGGAVAALGVGFIVFTAYQRSRTKRFTHPKFAKLWEICQERYVRLLRNLQKSKGERGIELQELQLAIERIMPEIYRSLRRADFVLSEIEASEKGASPSVAILVNKPTDPQARELYRVANQNVSEYSRYFQATMSGIERVEAQVHVFNSTLDTLRIRLLNSLLAGRPAEIDNREFLNIVAEAKMQFAAIDRALEEIEQMPFPRTVTLDADPAVEAMPEQAIEGLDER